MASYTRFTRALLSKPAIRKFSVSSARRTSSDKPPHTSWESLLSGRIDELEKTTKIFATKAEVQKVVTETNEANSNLFSIIGLGCFITLGICVAKDDLWDEPRLHRAIQEQKSEHQRFIEREVRSEVEVEAQKQRAELRRVLLDNFYECFSELRGSMREFIEQHEVSQVKQP